MRSLDMALNTNVETKSSPKGVEPTASAQYARIPSTYIVKEGTSEINIYVKKDETYQKIVSRNEVVDPEHPELKNNTYLYTDAEDLPKLARMSVLIAKSVAKSSSIDPAKKARLIKDSIEIVFEKASSFGIEQKLAEENVELISNYMHNLNDHSVYALLENFSAKEADLYSHTLVTTLLLCIIGSKRECSKEEMHNLVIAGMFHDIGQLRVNKELLSKPLALMSFKERHQLAEHVTFSRDILKGAQSFSDEVCEIVYQHHENIAGHGYPRGLRGEQLHKFARLLYAVDRFCDLIAKSAKGKTMPVEKAIDLLEKSDDVDQYVIKEIKNIVLKKQEKCSA